MSPGGSGCYDQAVLHRLVGELPKACLEPAGRLLDVAGIPWMATLDASAWDPSRLTVSNIHPTPSRPKPKGAKRFAEGDGPEAGWQWLPGIDKFRAIV